MKIKKRYSKYLQVRTTDYLDLTRILHPIARALACSLFLVTFLSQSTGRISMALNRKKPVKTTSGAIITALHAISGLSVSKVFTSKHLSL